ncbi:MAG: hypothetical protein GWP19_00575 [Planctomycetia bacterium]|nr:hypothetical protein [Planctomycetia bacterium]
MSHKVYKKLFKARQEMKKASKSGDNSFKKYSYVTLEDLYNVSLPPLFKEGLLVTHPKIYKEGILYLITKIIDIESNEYIFAESILDQSLDPQKLGSQITYFKKYDLGSLLALRTDFDDDGQSLEKIYLNDAQLTVLGALYNKLSDLSKENFLKYYKIDDLKELEANKFDTLLTFINRKLKEEATNA